MWSAAAAPAGGRAWSTFGPHAIGTERFATVSSGPSFAQVVGAILGKQAPVQNPDKGAVPSRSSDRVTHRTVTVPMRRWLRSVGGRGSRAAARRPGAGAG